MPATVKSLEERIDEMAEDLATVKSQVGIVVNGLSSIQTQLSAQANALSTMQAHFATSQAQLAVVVARLDSTAEESKLTRSKLEAMASDYSAFRSKSETTFGLVRWIGVFMAGDLITVILSAFSVARSAGSLETTVQQQQKTLDEIHHELTEIRAKSK